ncbi:MAG: Histidine kinase [uncultured Sulfurovum sp.]|uniref:histidine kinase n=1 Tax=uncultured Sulfurovum sp. TaxID=269237 RepID=A0A6S6RUA8_9BACT|nr:MAG: Histidine kinase [uncultured Sulfurovum sp.]
MNRHSLIFHISLFFVFLMLIINTLFYLQYELERQQKKEEVVERFYNVERLLHREHRDHVPPHEIDKKISRLFQLDVLHDLENIEAMKLIYEKDALSIYKEKDYIYYVDEKREHGHELVLRYKLEKEEGVSPLVFIFLINVLLLSFYLYIFKKIQPLQKLKKQIVRFSDGELEVSSALKGKDEISEVSNEFNNAIAKIKTLEESRNLFLRNIMHELKTPIAKGKLISDLIDDRKNQERLQRIFSRFEYLLGEFTKIEQVTSNSMILDKKTFRVVDILDNAFDILLMESSDVEIEINANLEMLADYELMSTAFKNLIDNALKYGSKEVKIIIDESSVSIDSYGDVLENTSFETAFNRAFEDSSKGLGLGLYITHHIVKKHGYNLEYEHVKGINKFIIHR